MHSLKLLSHCHIQLPGTGRFRCRHILYSELTASDFVWWPWPLTDSEVAVGKPRLMAQTVG